MLSEDLAAVNSLVNYGSFMRLTLPDLSLVCLISSRLDNKVDSLRKGLSSRLTLITNLSVIKQMLISVLTMKDNIYFVLNK